MSSSPDDFYKWAKDAGNKLRAYVLSYASGATAVFFLALTSKEVRFDPGERTLLISALLLYVLTAILCLVELHVDSRRFFLIAKQLERPEGEQRWAKNESLKTLRLRLIYASYLAAVLATIAVVIFLMKRIG